MPPNDSECDCLLNSLLGRKHTFDHHHHRHPTHSQALAASSHHSQQCHHPTIPPGPTTLCVSTSSADFGGQSTYYSAAAFYIMYMHTYICMYVPPSPPTHPAIPPTLLNAAIMLFYRGTIPNANINITNQGYILYPFSCQAGRSVGRVVVHLCNHRLINSQRINLSPSQPTTRLLLLIDQSQQCATFILHQPAGTASAPKSSFVTRYGLAFRAQAHPLPFPFVPL